MWYKTYKNILHRESSTNFSTNPLLDPLTEYNPGTPPARPTLPTNAPNSWINNNSKA